MNSGIGNRNSECQKRRSAFSLLEVLLALGLSVVIFAAIASAIRVHLIAIGQQQVKIEQRQLARNLLDMVANDLRAGIQYKATDFTGLENLVATQLTAIQAVDGLDDLDGLVDLFDEDQESSASSDSEEDPQPVVNEDAVSFRPTLIGDSSAIAIDVSRLPRMDQYGLAALGGESVSTSPSDIKSIGYFFSSVADQNETIDYADAPSPGGLYRREIDRAVASFRGDASLNYLPDEFSKLVAPEIGGIQFRYFDGTDWTESWDSAEMKGFPLAIEITLSLDPGRMTAAATNDARAAQSITNLRHVVHLPTAEICNDDDAEVTQ